MKNFHTDGDRSVPNDSVPCCEKWLCCYHEKLKIDLLFVLFSFLLDTTGGQGALLSPKTFLLAGETPYFHEGDWCGIFPHKVHLKGFFNNLLFPKWLWERHQEAVPRNRWGGSSAAQAGHSPVWRALSSCCWVHSWNTVLPGERKYFWWECEAG